MTAADVKRMSEAIASDLFHNGFGDEAVRLKMIDVQGRDVGGWCERAVVDRIADALKRGVSDDHR